MKRLVLLCLSALILLSGCGADTSNSVADEAPPTTADASATETQAEESVPELEIQEAPPEAEAMEDGDRAILMVNATVDGGRVLRVYAIGRAEANDRYAVKEIRTYEVDTLLRTLSVSDLPSEAWSGTEYGGEGETSAPTVEDALSVRDMNFDGADDLDLYGCIQKYDAPHHFLLWNTDAGEFQYAFTLPNAAENPETREIVSTYRLSDSVDCKDHYQYIDGALTLVSRVTEDWKGGSEDFPLVEVYEIRDGEEIFLRQEFTNYNDEGLTAREVRELVNGELTPVRVEILESADDGEFVVVRTEEIPLAQETENPETEDRETFVDATADETFLDIAAAENEGA